MVQGIDTRGRQCNLQLRQSMGTAGAVPTDAPAVLVCQAVACQYELDLNVGLLSVRLQ